jgi:hypothetical protein
MTMLMTRTEVTEVTGERARGGALAGAMMDMRPHVHRLLTNPLLETLPNRRYEGRVRSVVEETVVNRFKYTKDPTPDNPDRLVRLRTVEPLITFEDGVQWVPNERARKILVAGWGCETDRWIGRHMAVYLIIVARTDKASGRQVEHFEKTVELLREPGEDG